MNASLSGLPVELDLVIRLLFAGLVGAAVGLEREIHGHPAGLRTHLLVSLGSAVFTILSFHGFENLAGQAPDPTRIAAQVVSGIGFLGAGAILKEGFTIRGLTTAASLWGTAALGMACGVAEYVVAAAATAIIMISLWPLQPLVRGLARSRGGEARVDLDVAGLARLGAVRARLEEAGIEITGVRTRRTSAERFSVRLDLRHPTAADLYASLGQIAGMDGIEVVRVEQSE